MPVVAGPLYAFNTHVIPRVVPLVLAMAMFQEAGLTLTRDWSEGQFESHGALGCPPEKENRRP